MERVATIQAACGCVMEAEGEMKMARYRERCRPAGSVGLYVCNCGQVFEYFEQLQSHAYETDCLFPEITEEVAA